MLATFLATATPKKRLVVWALLAWLLVRQLQGLLTLLTLGGLVQTRFDRWYFWDAGYYVGIALRGYTPQARQLPGFFPLYPMMAHVLIALNFSWPAAMLLVSNLAALAALILVGLLVYRESKSEPAAVLAIWLLAVSPLGVFLSAMYSDSLFLALVAAAWLAARQQRWPIAGVALSLAVITRPFGIALAFGLLVEFIHQQRPWRELPWLILPLVMTLGGFLLVLWHSYGNPLAMVSIQHTDFGHEFWWPWQTIILSVHELLGASWFYPRAHMLLDIAPLLLASVCVAATVRKVPAGFSVYVCTLVVLCLVTPTVTAIGQYALISDGRYLYAAAPLLLIPIACWLSMWPRVASSALLLASLAVQLALVIFELHGGWLV
jgi:hypothetical protein